MQKNTRTVALIDGANLHRNISELGWKLDYRKFRTFLSECYGVECALIFLGYLPENRRLYQDLRRWGYSPVFRQTCRGFDGSVKGNCDGNLAVWAVASFFEQRYSSAVLVSGDGDFAALASFLVSRGGLKGIIAPSWQGCSRFLRQTRADLVFLDRLKSQLQYEPGPRDVNPILPGYGRN